MCTAETVTENETALSVPKCSSVSNCGSAIMSICFFHLSCKRMYVSTYACVCCSWKCARLPALWSEGRGWAVALSRLWVSPNTGSYSWPDQVDVRFCPSSAPHFHMNVEYAKEKKTSKILVPGSHRRVRKHTFAGRTLHPPPWQITEILAS